MATIHMDDPNVVFDAPGLFWDMATPDSTPIHMKQVKLALSGLKVNEVADLTDVIVAKMTGNAAFTTPKPALPGLTTAAAALRAKSTLIQTLESTLSTERDLLEAMFTAQKIELRMLASYVQNESHGDPAIIHSAGMEVKGERTAATIPTQVQNLKVSVSDAEGSLESEWQPVLSAVVYLVEVRADATEVWSQVAAITRARVSIPNLTPGGKYWVRVRAIGSAGTGPFSDVACKIAA